MTDAPLRHRLHEPFEGLLATGTSRLPFQRSVLLRSYLLRRAAGDVIVYNSPGIDDDAAAITGQTAPTRLLLNHAHEAMYGEPGLDVSIWVHRHDRAEVGDQLRVAGTFDQRQMIDDDLEVIPTPGHTPGTTCYLWDDGQHRFLFTGDFIWLDDGDWKAVVLDPRSRQDYLASLRLVRDLDFDVLVPWGATEGGAPVCPVPAAEKSARTQEIIDRVEAGGDR